MEVRRTAVSLLRRRTLTSTHQHSRPLRRLNSRQFSSSQRQDAEDQRKNPLSVFAEESSEDRAARDKQSLEEVLQGQLSFIKPVKPTSTSTKPQPSGSKDSSLAALIQQLQDQTDTPFSSSSPTSPSSLPSLSPYNLTSIPSSARDHAPTVAPPMTLDSRLGRTIPINERRSTDLARAFRMLDSRVAANQLRATANAQRFHERPGLRRKRLRSVRWRRRFKANFQAIVRRVEDMRRKGW